MEIQDPNLRSAENGTDIELFTAFRPMLLSRSKGQDRKKMISQLRVGLSSNEPFYIQAKVDGDRILMHKKGDQYRWFTR